MKFKLVYICVSAIALVSACSSERVPDTQRIEQDSAQKIMDTMPDIRLDTVAVK